MCMCNIYYMLYGIELCMYGLDMSRQRLKNPFGHRTFISLYNNSLYSPFRWFYGPTQWRESHWHKYKNFLKHQCYTTHLHLFLFSFRTTGTTGITVSIPLVADNQCHEEYEEYHHCWYCNSCHYCPGRWWNVWSVYGCGKILFSIHDLIAQIA